MTGAGSRAERDRQPARAGPAGLAGWVLFDWAAQPFYTLILTFIFAPYFAVAVIGDAVQGQTIWGYLTAVAGLVVALGGPVLGAVADASGPRKPWLAAFSLALIVSLGALWFATPDSGLTLGAGLALVVALIAAEFATIFTNAMMPGLVAPAWLGRLSGTGWALGYVGGLVSLLAMLGLVVTDPITGKTLLGGEPIWALDSTARQGDRLSGPFAALWYAVFVLPLFLFTPDRAASRAGRASLTSGLADLWITIKGLAHLPPVAVFLLARLAYADGLAALFAFGGIYGAGIFGWQAFELGLFGILLTVTGTLGALAGGVLDDWLGPRRVIIGALLGLMLAVLGILSIDRETIFFGLFAADGAGAGEAPPFSSAGEQAYLACGALIGLLAGPLQSASRSLLARLAPAREMTRFFGLFAFSGKITAFLAPFLIALATGAAQSQRAGVAVIALFFLVGLAVMARVRIPA